MMGFATRCDLNGRRLYSPIAAAAGR